MNEEFRLRIFSFKSSRSFSFYPLLTYQRSDKLLLSLSSLSAWSSYYESLYLQIGRGKKVLDWVSIVLNLQLIDDTLYQDVPCYQGVV